MSFLSLKGDHRSDPLCFHTTCMWLMWITTWLLSPPSSHCFWEAKLKGSSEIGRRGRSMSTSSIWGSRERQAFICRRVRRTFSSPELDCSWDSGGFGSRRGVCSKKPLCTVSFKLAVKDTTVLPAVTAAGQSEVALGTLIVNFLTPLQFQTSLKTTFFFFFLMVFLFRKQTKTKARLRNAACAARRNEVTSEIWNAK